MDFKLSPELKKAKEKLIKIFQIAYDPKEEEILLNDSHDGILVTIVLDHLKKEIIEQNLWAVEIPENGTNRLGFVGRVLLEEVAGRAILPHIDLGGRGDMLVWNNVASVEQKKEYFEPVLKGLMNYEVVCLEPNLDEDNNNIRIKAIENKDSILLNGERNFNTSKLNLDFLIILASLVQNGKEEPAFFLVDSKKNEGMKVNQVEPLPLGFKRMRINLTDCEVSAKTRIGKKGQGLEIMERLECLRNLILSARSIGAASKCIEATLDYFQSNEKLNRHQAIQTMLADSVVEIHAARLLTLVQSKQIEEENFNLMMCSLAKVFSTEAATNAIEKMIQIWADKGYLREFPLEILFRIVRYYRIIDRPSEVYRKFIAYNLMDQVSS